MLIEILATLLHDLQSHGSVIPVIEFKDRALSNIYTCTDTCKCLLGKYLILLFRNL